MNAIDYEGDKVLREIVDYVNTWLNSRGTEVTWEDEKDNSYVIVDERGEGVIALSIGNGDDGGNAAVVALIICNSDDVWEDEIQSITYSFDGMIGIVKGNTSTKGV